jgi:hypothetical protein
LRALELLRNPKLCFTYKKTWGHCTKIGGAALSGWAALKSGFLR